MYTAFMRRIQIYIEEEIDDALRGEAARTGRSKAALIRDCVAASYAPAGRERDPISELVGSIDAEPADVDDVVYGR